MGHNPDKCTLKQNSQYLCYPLHLTRWVAPYPQYTPSIVLTPPLVLVAIKLKRSKSHMYHLLPSILQTHRQTHRCTNMYVSSPRHSTSFHQISTLKPYPIKSYTHSLVILITTPYQTQNASLSHKCFGYFKHTT